MLPEDQTRLFAGKSRRGSAPSGTTEAKRKASVIKRFSRLAEALLGYAGVRVSAQGRAGRGEAPKRGRYFPKFSGFELSTKLTENAD